MCKICSKLVKTPERHDCSNVNIVNFAQVNALTLNRKMVAGKIFFKICFIKTTIYTLEEIYEVVIVSFASKMM